MNASQKRSLVKGNVKTTSKVNDEKYMRRKLLLRTCFRIWSQTTFGRVSPAKARQHYRRKMITRCLMVWKNSHLPSRKDWKLQIRAEYHDRFRLWQKCLNAWKVYIVLNKESKSLKTKATQHADKRLLMKCLSSMKRSVQLRKVKKLFNGRAADFHHKTLQRRLWQNWIYMFNNQCTLKNLDYRALQHWAQTIVVKMFIRWQNVFMDRCDLKKRIVYSEVYYSTSLVRKTMAHWKDFIEVQREKRKDKDLADIKFQRNLLGYLFEKWRRTHQLSLHVRESEMTIISLGHKAIRRRYFTRLKIYYQRKLYYQQQFIDAAETHNNKIKVTYFQRLKIAVKLSKEKVKHNEEASEFRTKKLLLKYFMQWMMKCDHKEDIKLIPLSRIAYRYYRLKQITWVIYQWKQYVKMEQKQRRLWHLAEFHHNMRILPRCLIAWKQFKEIKQEVVQMNNLAMEFNRELMYSKYFYTWIKHFKLCIDDASMEDIAIGHFNSTVVKIYFSYWKKCKDTCLLKKCLQDKASQLYSNHLLLSALKKWKSVYHENNSSLNKMLTAKSFYNKKIKEKCWCAYRKFYWRSKKRHLKELNADIFYKKKLLSDVMILWKCYVDEQRIIYDKVNCICAEKAEITCRWVFLTWKQYIKEEKQRKKSNQKADIHFRYALKHRVFTMLRQYSIRRIEKRFIEDEAVIRAQIRMEKSYLRNIFTKWTECSKELYDQKDKLVIALNHYNNLLFTKSISRWKQFVCHSLKVKVFRLHAMSFCIRKIESIHFQRWKLKYQMLIAENQKSNVAIWWWSYQLQRKVLQAMVRYTSYQHQKKKDYNAALIFRKNLLIEKGVVNWLQFASHSINRRREIAYKEQTKRTMELQARVHKYALIWLRKTQAGKNIPKYPNSLHTNIVVKSDEVLKNVTPCISSPLTRCKIFDVKFPKVTSRPPPRLPEYLRESFELSNFKQRSIYVASGNTNINSIPDVQRTSNLDVEDEISPRTINITNMCTMHSPVVHPMARSYSDSIKCLELTDDVILEKITSDEKEAVLLPPSKFTKVSFAD